MQDESLNSIVGTSRSIWPRVSSRGAHRVVQAVYDGINDSMVDLKHRQYAFQLTPAAAEYRDWVRERLAGCDLAQLIAGGTGSLPDIAERLPLWAQPLERFHRPRTVEQVTWHVIRNLEWYLRPTSEPKVSAFGFVLGGSVLLLLGGLAWFLTWLVKNSAGGPGAQVWWIPVISVLPAVIINAVAYAGRGQGMGVAAGAQAGTERYIINAAEFYWYVTEALADPPGDPLGGTGHEHFEASDILDSSLERAKARL